MTGRPSSTAAMLVLGAVACRTAPAPRVGAVVPEAPPPSRVASERAGIVVDGRFIDRYGHFEVEVPVGWRARVGTSDGARRLSLDSPETGARIEIWRHPAGAAGLPDRRDCIWTFVDEGPYVDLRVLDARTVGTCMPDDPDRPRIQAWRLERSGWDWHIEVHLPQAGMMHARRAAVAVLESARWER